MAIRQISAFVFVLAGISSCNENVSVTDSDTVDTLTVRTEVRQDSSATTFTKSDTSGSVVISDPVAEVELTVLFTRFYCGGARPTDEMVAELQRPKALTKSTLILKSHSSGKSYSVNTNASGKVQVRLDAGKYDVYLTERINADLNTGFQPDCKQWLEKSLATIKLAPEQKSVAATINFECNPCNTNKPM